MFYVLDCIDWKNKAYNVSFFSTGITASNNFLCWQVLQAKQIEFVKQQLNLI